MNTIYRIIWNAATQSWAAASELSRSRSKSKSLRRTTLALATVAALSAAPVWAQTYDTVISTDQTGTTTLTNPGNVLVDTGVTLANPSNTSPALNVTYSSSNPWAITNQGAISGYGSSAADRGILAATGSNGVVQNIGTIAASNGFALTTAGQSNTVINQGSVSTTGDTISAVVMNGSSAGDDLQKLVNEKGATISSASTTASSIYGAASLWSSGRIEVINDGDIVSGDAASGVAGMGLDVNMQTGKGSGFNPTTSGSTVINSGTIAGAGIGLRFNYGGFNFVHNQAGGQIVDNSVGMQLTAVGAGLVLTNYSTSPSNTTIVNDAGALIGGSGSGILNQGRADVLKVSNAGTISGGAGYIYGAGISSTWAQMDIANTGIIEGYKGIDIGYGNATVGGPDVPNTIYNAGTITGTGGTAISFGGLNGDHNILTLDTGSVLNGVVNGDYYNRGKDQNDLILQGTNADTFDKFLSFQTLTVQDAGAGTDWTMDGYGSFSQNATIAGGTLRLADALTTLDTPTTTVNAGGTLAGYGTVLGDVVNNTNGMIAPGSAGTPGGAFGALTLQGNYVGNGGRVTLNTVLNEGGALSTQQTDRLLITGAPAPAPITTQPGGGGGIISSIGDVGVMANTAGSASGTTYLVVNGSGAGANTDLNNNGIVDNNEGISLVQVHGTSTADAFKLAGDYVAVGPWMYTLHPFGPGAANGPADQTQSVLPSGDSLDWDYRLASTYETPTPAPTPSPTPTPAPTPTPTPSPGPSPTPAPGPSPIDPLPDDHSESRTAVAPQVGSYVSSATALLGYGGQMIDTLHQRLGEIRNVQAKDNGDHGGEMFARYIGTQYRYDSDLNFQQYGYDFDQRVNMLQLGGSILGWNNDKSSIRFGVAADHGTTDVTPQRTSIGSSTGKYTANGFSAWMTWQQDNGFYIDTVVGGERYKGDISTSLRGQVATLNAHGWHASIESGYPFALGQGYELEPQAQVSYQSLVFNNVVDKDGLDVKLGDVGQATYRLGARLTKHDNARFAPYLRADYINRVGGRQQVDVSSTDWTDVSASFAGGRAGASYRLGAGATSQFSKNLAVYGEVDYQGALNTYGTSGWTANVGLRWNF